MRWSWQRTRFVREVLGLMGYLNWAKWGGREQSQTQGNSSLITLVSTYFDEASHQPSNPSNPSQIITNPWIFGWIVIDQDTPPRPSTSRVGRELRRGAINSDWSRVFSSLNTRRAGASDASATQGLGHRAPPQSETRPRELVPLPTHWIPGRGKHCC